MLFCCDAAFTVPFQASMRFWRASTCRCVWLVERGANRRVGRADAQQARCACGTITALTD